MNKAELISAIAEKSDINKSKAAAAWIPRSPASPPPCAPATR